MTFIFEVPGKPQGKQRVRVCMHGGFARAYTPDTTVSYENLIALMYKQQGGGSPILAGTPVNLEIEAVYSIPKSFSKKRTDEAVRGLLYPLTKPDIDNIVKVVCDALNGIAYHDDCQIVKVISTKKYGVEPKLTITINY